ncbi:9210_t:CDS:2 [Paraglomus occultum]|uniref:very-long-chain enoyl-CoA reductase n=1 Tax=Paraglomus occultum TaxID=144539 RepID=A0A9N9B7W9_9GLOM|nr:9210_t:CDS:2 [Paraglomus occultum]
MKLTVAPRTEKKNKHFPLTVDLVEDATVNDLKKAIHKRIKKFYPERQRLTYNDQVLDDRKKRLSDYGIKSEDKILFKDLGPQVAWRTVFLIEYLGPLVIHPIFYYGSRWIYGEEVEHSKMQTVTFYLVMLHFIKRELETIFVHRFSNDTMPIRNIIKNSVHYHILSGLFLAYAVYGTWSAAGTSGERDNWYIGACVAVWIWAELSNLMTHINLRNLRPPGTRIRKIPYGYGFNLVSCPNYFFEIVAWAAIAVLTQSIAAIIFLVFAIGQMHIWAVKKHKKYRSEFKDYPKNRKALIPFVV